MRRLLLVDDEENVLSALCRTLRLRGIDLVTARSGDEALQILERTPCEVVCSDARMPGMSGLALLEAVKERWPRTQRLMITGNPDLDAMQQAINGAEVFRLIAKPWTNSQLVEVIEGAFAEYEAERERLDEAARATEQNEALRETAHTLEEMVEARTRQLSVAKREWEVTFDAIGLPVALLGRDGTVRRANRAFAALAHSDITAVAGRKCSEVLFGSESTCPGCTIEHAVACGQQGEAEISTRDERTYKVKLYPSAELDSVVAVYEDVTEQRRLHANAMQSEKMVALGQLAGGVAHEINNPVAGILAFVQLMLRDAGRTEEDLEALTLMEQSALRVKRIVDSMLRFARRGKPEQVTLNLAKPVTEAIVLFEILLKTFPKAKLVNEMPEELPEVAADPNQVQQIVLNLLQNAVQALPGGAGTLSVRGGVDGERVYFTVSDTGSGIRPEHLPKIFEATFTTKAPGHGTGFGLSIVKNIVDAHGGEVRVDTRVGAGTTFTVLFPRLAKSARPDLPRALAG